MTSPLRDRLPPPRDLAAAAFALLIGLAARGERISYSDFAFELGLPSPRNLGWLLGPLLAWCRARDLPLLPIIVVRKTDGLPSGGYDVVTIAAETARVFAHDWSAVTQPSAAELAPFGSDAPRRSRRFLRSAACP